MTCHNCASQCRKYGRNRNGTQRFHCPVCRKSFSEPRKTIGNGYLPWDQASRVIHLLCEGASIRSIERLTEVHRETIINLLRHVGQGCKSFARRRVRAEGRRNR